MPSSSTLNRRAALTGAIAAVPVLAGVAIVAGPSQASPAHADAALFALLPEIEAADRLEIACEEKQDAAEDTFSDATSAELQSDEARDSLRVQVGLTAAKEAHRNASVAACEARDRLANMRAKTLAGLVFKAKLAAAYPRDVYDDELVASIIEDLLVMTDGHQARAWAA